MELSSQARLSRQLKTRTNCRFVSPHVRVVVAHRLTASGIENPPDVDMGLPVKSMQMQVK
jgi:hypothetical protein